jgi:uncharacterized OsmC-like protein
MGRGREQKTKEISMASSTSAATSTPRNGVNVPVLFATLDAVKGQRELAKFQFRAKNRWISGTHSRSTIGGYFGAGAEQARATPFTYDGDHPAVLVGGDSAPTPVEYLLHAIAACLTAGIGNIASARGINLEEVEAEVEGNINLLGLLGIDPGVRNGYQGIRVSFRIKGDASDDELRKIVMRSRDRSAVYDVLTNGVPVDIDVKAERA